MLVRSCGSTFLAATAQLWAPAGCPQPYTAFLQPSSPLEANETPASGDPSGIWTPCPWPFWSQ